VTIDADEATLALLRRHERDLPMLFIVSDVTLGTGTNGGVTVQVSRAPGEKCPRCWRFVPALTSAPAHGTAELPNAGEICGRCAGALGTPMETHG
jgi:isoleucyl-tRNA synthetase